jgi:predicted nucleic acid-binding protein
VITYADTSVIVKLYVEEEDSGKIARLIDNSRIVATSEISYVEFLSAIFRKKREKEIKELDFKHIKEAFQKNWNSYLKIKLTADVIATAGSLLERYPLKAYDAIHIGSARHLKGKVKEDILFLTADTTQMRSAKKDGFLISH